MSWKLILNQKPDQKLLPNFPQDPFSDITIQTASQELHLSLAYLAIDSGYFSQIDPGTHCIYLKHLEEAPLVMILQALYGGDLEASTVQELEELLKIILYLDIQEFKDNIEKGLISLHLTRLENSPLNSVEMLEFCLKNNVIKDYICNVHYRNQLKTLESSKNYLQLGKLSKNNLNHLLLSYLLLEGPQAGKTINTILDNYFNRKSYRPVDYLNDLKLQPLRKVWEDFHHKILVAKPMTKTFPKTSTRGSVLLYETTSPDRQNSKIKLQRLSMTTRSFNLQHINMGQSVLRSDNSSEDSLLDLRLDMLRQQEEEKDSTIEYLRKEMRQLQEQVQLRGKGELGELSDVTLLQNVARSRIARQNLASAESRISQNAFQLHRATEERQKVKSACKYQSTFSKKSQLV